jgi:hypothetical protein
MNISFVNKNINLKNIKMEDLKDICRNNNIKGFSNINKDSLISLIKKNKKMSGGFKHIWSIPNTRPETQSWLFMPIIYKALGENIIFPKKFYILIRKYIVDNSLRNVPEGLNITNNTTNNNVSTIFFEYVRSILENKNINSINDLPLNGQYHIKGEKQEEYLYQNDFMANILGYLVENLIDSCKKKI